MITSKNIYSVRDISEELGVNQSKVLHWYDNFTDYFEANPNKLEKEFSQNDFMLFQLIYKLNITNELTLSEVKSHIKEYTSELHQSKIIEPEQPIKSPSVINKEIQNIVATQIDKSIDKYMKSFALNIAKYIDDKIDRNFHKLVEQNKDLLEQNMETQQMMMDDLKTNVSEIQEQTKKDLTDMLSDNLTITQNQFKSELDNITHEMKEIETRSNLRDTELSTLLKENMELRRKEFKEKEEQKKKKGFFKRIFG